MTTTSDPANTAPHTPALVEPMHDTRLESLCAQYDLAKAEADKAAETLKTITEALKAEMVAAAPGRDNIVLDSIDLARPLQLQQIESWRVDARKLKADDPVTYVRYAKKSLSWRLAPLVRSS